MLFFPSRVARRLVSGAKLHQLYIAISLCFILSFFVVPLVLLLISSLLDGGLFLGNYAQVLTEGLYVKVLLHTVVLALTVALACGLCATILAFALLYSSFMLRRALLVSLLVPLLVNPLAIILGWTYLLQRHGVFNNVLAFIGLTSSPLGLLYNFGAVVTVMCYLLVPYVALPSYIAMKNVSGQYALAARNLGASTMVITWRIVLPLVLPAITSGLVLVFLISLGYFVSPALIGGSQQTTISMLVENRINYLLDWRLGSAICVVLLAIVFALMAVLWKRLVMQGQKIAIKMEARW